MKKIILVLMMMVSASFAFTFPTYYSANGQNYKKSDSASYDDSPICSNTLPYNFVDGSPTYTLSGSSYTAYYRITDPLAGTVNSICYKLGRAGYSYYESSTTYYSDNSCQSPNTIVDGECVEPTPVPACDYVTGKYLNPSTNTCTDCSSFPTVAGRASCACDSQGSTYNNQAVTGTTTATHGFTNYDRTEAKCANGGYIPVYTNPRPVDNNSTTPTPTPTPDTNGSGTGDTGGGTGGTGGTGGGTGTGGTGGVTPTPTPDTNTSGGSTGGGSTGTTNYADLITQLKTNNQSVNDFKDKFTKFVTSDQANADRQYNATNAIKSAVDGTTSAVNTQGTAITSKLGDILSAIKDGNGTGKSGDGNSTNNVDLNATNKKLDTLHDDNNKTQGILDKIKGMFDNNDSFKVPDANGSTPKVEDLIKDENWINANKMKLNFSAGSGDCYCQTAQFEVGGRTFVFPPQELLDMIPFDVISKMLMAFVYLIGLRQFLRN